MGNNKNKAIDRPLTDRSISPPGKNTVMKVEKGNCDHPKDYPNCKDQDKTF